MFVIKKSREIEKWLVSQSMFNVNQCLKLPVVKQMVRMISGQACAYNKKRSNREGSKQWWSNGQNGLANC